MAQETHSGLPASMSGGDSLVWRESAPDDVADLSAAFYWFKNPDSGERFKVTGAVDPSDAASYLYTVQGSATADLPPGDYVGSQVLEYDDERKTLRDTGTIRLYPNPEKEPDESHNARVVRLLEQHIEGRLPAGMESYTVGGVPIEKMPMIDAVELLKKYRGMLRTEREQAASNEGRSTGQRILTTFQNP